MQVFYQEKLKECQNLSMNFQQIDASFVSDRLSKKKFEFMESFDRKNMKSGDFQYFNNSVLINLQKDNKTKANLSENGFFFLSH